MFRTNYTYDARNLRITQVDAYGTPLQRTLTTVYDANGNLIQSIDALGYTTAHGYDALNRRISVQRREKGVRNLFGEKLRLIRFLTPFPPPVCSVSEEKLIRLYAYHPTV